MKSVSKNGKRAVRPRGRDGMPVGGRIADRIRVEQDLLIRSLSEAMRHNGAIAALLECVENGDARTGGTGNGPDMKEDGAGDRRIPFRFDSYGIPTGAELAYTKDPSVRPVVADSQRVEYGGRLWTLSGLATELNGTPSNGPASFRYNGERLVNLRNRIDSERASGRKS